MRLNRRHWDWATTGSVLSTCCWQSSVSPIIDSRTCFIEIELRMMSYDKPCWTFSRREYQGRQGKLNQSLPLTNIGQAMHHVEIDWASEINYQTFGDTMLFDFICKTCDTDLIDFLQEEE